MTVPHQPFRTLLNRLDQFHSYLPNNTSVVVMLPLVRQPDPFYSLFSTLYCRVMGHIQQAGSCRVLLLVPRSLLTIFGARLAPRLLTWGSPVWSTLNYTARFPCDYTPTSHRRKPFRRLLKPELYGVLFWLLICRLHVLGGCLYLTQNHIRKAPTHDLSPKAYHLTISNLEKSLSRIVRSQYSCCCCWVLRRLD